MRLANSCAWPSSSWTSVLEGLDDLLGAHAVGVDRVRDVAHHGLDLHEVGLLEHLDELLALRRRDRRRGCPLRRSGRAWGVSLRRVRVGLRPGRVRGLPERRPRRCARTGAPGASGRPAAQGGGRAPAASGGSPRSSHEPSGRRTSSPRSASSASAVETVGRRAPTSCPRMRCVSASGTITPWPETRPQRSARCQKSARRRRSTRVSCEIACVVARRIERSPRRSSSAEVISG